MLAIINKLYRLKRESVKAGIELSYISLMAAEKSKTCSDPEDNCQLLNDSPPAYSEASSVTYTTPSNSQSADKFKCMHVSIYYIAI